MLEPQNTQMVFIIFFEIMFQKQNIPSRLFRVECLCIIILSFCGNPAWWND